MSDMKEQEPCVLEPGGACESGGEQEGNLHKASSQRVSRFMALPAELRIKIYELALAPSRRQHPRDPDSADHIDSVALCNALLLRKKLAPTPLLTAHLSHTYLLYRQFYLRIWTANEGMRRRCHRMRLPNLPAVRETALLRVSKQVHSEALDVLYSQTTFAVTTPICYCLSKGATFVDFIPSEIDRSRIRRFRLEILLGDCFLPTTEFREHSDGFASFLARLFRRIIRKMRDLQRLQIFVTGWVFAPSPGLHPRERAFLKSIKEGIPAHVEVTWGMTDEEEEYGDYSGTSPVSREELREIVGAE